VRRYLLDTGTAGDHLDQRHGVHVSVQQATRRGDRVGLCVPVVGELFAGIQFSASRDRNEKRLRRVLSALVVWPFDLAAAAEFGRIVAMLRRRGRPMQQIDIQIAAVAKTLGNCTVVTSDTDFDAIPGLKVENWRE